MAESDRSASVEMPPALVIGSPNAGADNAAPQQPDGDAANPPSSLQSSTPVTPDPGPGISEIWFPPLEIIVPASDESLKEDAATPESRASSSKPDSEAGRKQESITPQGPSNDTSASPDSRASLSKPDSEQHKQGDGADADPGSPPSTGNEARAALGGAGAGLIEFLAESTASVPSGLMVLSPTTALLLEPLYSAAAEGLHQLAAEEQYKAAQEEDTAAQRGAAAGYFGATVISSLVGPKRNLLGPPAPKITRWTTAIEDTALSRTWREILSEQLKKATSSRFARAYVIVPSISRSTGNVAKLEKKLGVKADGLVYRSETVFIASDKYLKNVKSGLGTKQDSNHLVLAEWFRKGPKNLRGLEHFVPACLLRQSTEHQSTFHGAVNQFLKSQNLYQQPRYSQKQIEDGMKLLEDYYRKNPGGQLGRDWAEAVRDFRLNVFEKAK